MRYGPPQCEPQPIQGKPGFFECRFCGRVNRRPTRKPWRSNCGVAPPKDLHPLGIRSSAEVERLVANHCRVCAQFPYSRMDGGGRIEVVEICGAEAGCKKRATARTWRTRIADARVPCPLGRWDEHVDVLYGINAKNQEWVESKASVPVAILNDRDVSALTWDVYGQPAEELRHALRRNTPGLVVNCAMFIPVPVLEDLAGEFPGVRFVTSCHSSQSDLARNSHWLTRQFDYLELARRRPNCFYALVDERVEFYRVLACDRLVHLNNCVPLPVADPCHQVHDPPVVSLICEWRQLKNVPNQLLAVALAARQVDLRLLLAIKNDGEGLARKFAEGLGLAVDLRPWQTWSDYRRMIAEEIDVGLQASFTESFNFVALDHLQHGCPVIGSPAVRFLPPAWQANPDDPRDIARRLVRVIRRYNPARRLARRTAHRKAASSNAAFFSSIESLLNGVWHDGPRSD